jgi:hypothetical protein
MTIFRVISLLSLVVVVSCDSNAGIHNQSQADVLPDGEVVIADAVARVSNMPCDPALNVQLLSYGTGLRVEAYEHVDEDCEATDDYPALAHYTIKNVEYYAGRKTYLASSPLGALWIHDDRQFDPAAGWNIVTYNYEASIVPGYSPWMSYSAKSVNDENLRPSGQTTYWVRVWFQQAIAKEEVEKVVYSLQLDMEQSRAVDMSDQTAYDVLIISDFPVAHVLSQLRALTLVKNANLR